MGTALVGLEVRQHASAESLSKRAPSTTRTSLRVLRILHSAGLHNSQIANCNRNCDTPPDVLLSLTGTPAGANHCPDSIRITTPSAMGRAELDQYPARPATTGHTLALRRLSDESVATSATSRHDSTSGISTIRFVQSSGSDAVQIDTRSSMTAPSGVRCLARNTPGLERPAWYWGQV